MFRACLSPSGGSYKRAVSVVRCVFVSHCVTEFIGFNAKYFVTAVFGFWTHL